MTSSTKHNWLIALLGHWRWFCLHVLVPVCLSKIRYPLVLKRLRRKFGRQKFKVLFLVGSPAKWKAQSLFDLMTRSDVFDPLIVCTICDAESFYEHARKVAHMEMTLAFFQKKGMPCVSGYSFARQECVDLNDFEPDFVFYHQPWDVHPLQLPHHVAKRALTFHIPYFVPNYGDVATDTQTPFHRTLFAICCLNDDWCRVYERAARWMFKSWRLLPTGHTSLDIHYDECADSMENGFVIYAPHWSFNHPSHQNFENYSTFLWTGRLILEFAKKHPEIRWAFKPHPSLRFALEHSDAWTQQEIDDYYGEWDRISVSWLGGDYQQLFAQSRAMITDCGSFLVEYVITGRPIIHLISPDCKITPLPPAKKLFDSYYQVHDLCELDDVLAEIILKDLDPRKDERLAAAREFGAFGSQGAVKIMNYLSDLLNANKG